MNNKFYFLKCICVIISLSIFSSCNSNSDKVKEMEKIIISAHTKINNLDFRDSIPDYFTYSAIHRNGPLHEFLGQVTEICHLDSISYIGHNWFQVSYDCCDSECPKVYYWGIAKQGNKYKLARHAKAYSQCTAGIKNLSYADRIKFWFNSKKYDYVEDYFYVNGSLCKVQKDDKYGLINLEGEEIVPCKYDHIYPSKDLFRVELNNKCGYINSKGEEISPFYDEHEWYGRDKYEVKLYETYTTLWYDDRTDLYKVKSDNKYGIIYDGGKELIPCKYDDIEKLEDSKGYPLYKVKLDNKCGIINGEGKEIFPFLFNDIYFAKDDQMLKVQRENLWGYYTIDGTQVTDFYEDIEYYYKDANNSVCNLDHPIFAVKSNGKWGYLDESFDTLIEFVLDYAGQPYKDGTAFVEYNGQYGEIDLYTGYFYRKNNNNYDNSSSNSSYTKRKCRECNGYGTKGNFRCSNCGGLGFFI